jgi:hypothetical protein
MRHGRETLLVFRRISFIDVIAPGSHNTSRFVLSALFSYPSPATRPILIIWLQVYSSSEVLASIDSVVTEFLLDAENLVELGEALRTSWRAGLDLSST